MKRSATILFVLLICSALLLATCGSASTPVPPTGPPASARYSQPVKVFLDTDIAGDVDDAGAAAVLNALSDNGEAEIVGMAVNTSGAAGLLGAQCLDAINTSYGRPNILIGRSTTGINPEHDYTDGCANNFPQDLGNNPPTALTVYRQILAGQPDKSVVIVSVGFLNNLEDLLKSPADEYSSMNGLQLVTAKVNRLSWTSRSRP